LRVALVLDRFTPHRGGLESWATRFAAWLLERGDEVHGVAFEYDHAAMPPNLLRHSMPRPPGRLDRARALDACVASLPNALVHDFGLGWRYDLLHVHAGSRRTVLRQVIRARPLGGKLLGLLERVRAWHERHLERTQYTQGHGRIVAVSQMVKRDLVRDYGVDPARIEVVWNGVDTVMFSPAYRERERPAARRRLELGEASTFLLVGHNYVLKGLPVALRALARLVQEGRAVRLCVVGNGPVDVFTREVARLGLGRHVQFHRGVTDTRPYLAASDVLLHPTFYDSCSLVVLEAWAMGVAAITTRWNGVRDLWPAAEHGWLVVEPGDTDAVAQAMRLALDPARRAGAGAVGRSVALAHSLESNFARIAAIYEEIVEGSPPRRL
jgi:UDP-glucose:(heptosyl)LPS alpha-1,3-glucosyltransferase